MIRMRIRRLMTIISISSVLFCLGGCTQNMQNDGDQVLMTQDHLEDDALMTIDGISIEENAFVFELRNQKATVINLFSQKGADTEDPEFWNSSFEGLNPLEEAKTRATQALIRQTVQQKLASDVLMDEVLSYSQVQELLEQKNQENQQLSENDQVVYGNVQMEIASFMAQQMSLQANALQQAWIERVHPDQSQLEQLYEDNVDQFSTGTCYVFDRMDSKGNIQTMEIDSAQLPKEGSEEQDLIENYFSTMSAGDVIEQYTWDDQPCTLILKSITPSAPVAFEQVKDQLIALFAARDLEETLQKMADQAKVIIQQDQYDAISMP